MDLEKFIATLNGLENGAEMVEFFETAVKTETNKGVSMSHKANVANAKFKKQMQKLGWDGVADSDEFVETLLNTLDGIGTQDKTELSDLQLQMKKLKRDFELSQSELKTEKEQREVLQKQNKIKTIESKLIPKLSSDLNGASVLVKALLADGSVDVDDLGEIVIKNGDNIFKFDEGVKHIINSNQDLRKNKQNGGVGSTLPSSNTSVNNGKPKYTMEQIRSMSDDESSNNVEDIMESLKLLSEQT